jgi:uncharacterized protein YbjT (DUF2867 family)
VPERIAALHRIETTSRGLAPEPRRRLRHHQSRPLGDDLRAWLDAERVRVPGRSGSAEAIRHAPKPWAGLGVFLADGRVELDSDPVERSIRPPAPNRQTASFAGSDPGGVRWGVVAALDREAHRRRPPGRPGRQPHPPGRPPPRQPDRRPQAPGRPPPRGLTTSVTIGTAAETAQGIAMVEAIKAVAIGHLVFGSVASADQGTGIPHFDSKYEVEKRLASIGVPYSIVAPAYFMENLLAPWNLPALREGKLALAMPADRPLQQVAVSDIGAFAAALIERREAVFGKRHDIAGDELTGAQMAAAVSQAGRREIRYEGFPPDVLRAQSEDLALMFEWFDRVGYSADIEALRHEFPEVPWLTFEAWLSKQDLAELG